jgi:GGDEF domain-containing protein
MDSLKEINEKLGHAEGNDALCKLGDLLERSLSAKDEVARVGGDEFAVISVAPTVEGAAALDERLEAVLAAEGCRITFGWAASLRDGRTPSRSTAPPTSGSTRASCSAATRAASSGWSRRFSCRSLGFERESRAAS